MKKAILLLSILLLFIVPSLHAQAHLDTKRDRVWKMGYSGYTNDSRWLHQTFTFNDNGEFDLSTTTDTAGFAATFASICDTAGQLVCYTNGGFLYDRNNNKMRYDALNPSSFVTNLGLDGKHNYACFATILPMPDSQHLYYVFHLRMNEPHAGPNSVEGLYYTVVDDRLRNGLGGVTQWRVPIVNQDSLEVGKLNAVRHANGRDWWITCWHRYFKEYRLCLLDPTGVHDYGWQQIQTTAQVPNGGQSAFSPDGTKWAGTTYNYLIQQSRLDIFDFDRCTGALTNHQQALVPITNTFSVGLSFSPNSKNLYVSSSYAMLQYDMESSDIFNSVDTVAVNDGFIDSVDITFPVATGFFYHYLAPNGKIYISTGSSTHYLSTIDNPDVRGSNCSVQQHSILLPAYAIRTIPNFPNFRLGALQGSPCDTLYNSTTTQAKDRRIKVFPNPTNNILNIEYADYQNKQLFITDVLGRTHKTLPLQNETTNINIAHLPNGIYYLNLYEDNHCIYTTKFVVLHE